MHSLRSGAQHLAIHHPAIIPREPDGRRMRPTPMLYDILAIIALVAVACWLVTTAPR
ncbi:membrane protein [Gordonia phage Bradissa]|nr:membrane protein [Gordonia phage Bradissa]